MDLDMAIVVEKTQFTEFIHKKADARSGRADNFRQCLLADVGTDRLRLAILSEIRQQQKRTREPSFARIEKLINEICFNSAVAAQKMGHEQFGKSWLLMEEFQHR